MRVEDRTQCGCQRRGPYGVAGVGHLTDQLEHDSVLSEHRLHQEPALGGRPRGRVHRLFLGASMRDQFPAAPVHQVQAGPAGRLGIVGGRGSHQLLDAQAQRAGQFGMVLPHGLDGPRIRLAPGNHYFRHVQLPLESCRWHLHRHFITLNSVENNRGYGPAPSTGRARAPLSRSRAALLESLRAQGEPTTLAALTAATGLHVNTVREHLDALVRAGLAHRHASAPAGRGRPAWLYEATGGDAAAAAAPEYAGLAATLAASIQRTSSSPHEDAITAGQDWGHELARAREARPEPNPTAARRQVVALLDALGFAPQADARATSVRLARCPLLEAAYKYPDVVCGVHLGLVRGALEEYGADDDGTELLPFAEPGACRLRIRARPR